MAWLSVAVVLLLRPPSARAGTYNYPQAKPVLSLTLPDGWIVSEQDGPAKILLCSPPGDSTYNISVISLPTAGGPVDLKDLLTRITRAGATGAEMTDIKVSDATEEMIGVRVFTKVAAYGNHNDEESAFVYYAFRWPASGRFYAVGAAGLQAMIDAHRADFERVAASILAAK